MIPRVGKPAPAQLDPSRLAPFASWEWRCPVAGCLTITQGGYGGLEAHLATVHPERGLHRPAGRHRPGRRR